eukprot:1478653-Pyramimonas_sp.AAC.1
MSLVLRSSCGASVGEVPRAAPRREALRPTREIAEACGAFGGAGGRVHDSRRRLGGRRRQC